MTAYAQAASVRVSLQVADGRALFAIRDDGRGCSADDVARARDGGSFGLQSMADRLRSEGGEFTFTSQPGLGTEVQGWLPLSALQESRDFPERTNGIST